MGATIIIFPGLNIATVEYADPNLSRLFKSDELYKAWDSLELAATKKVRSLLKEKAVDASPDDVIRLASLFLHRAAERVLVRPPSRAISRS